MIRGLPEEGTPGKTRECTEDESHMDVQGKRFLGRGTSSAKALGGLEPGVLEQRVREVGGDEVKEERGGSRKGLSKCPFRGASPLRSPRNMSTGGAGTALSSWSSSSQPRAASRRPAFRVQPGKLSPAISHSHGPARHHLCPRQCHRNTSLRLSPGRWSWRSGSNRLAHQHRWNINGVAGA